MGWLPPTDDPPHGVWAAPPSASRPETSGRAIAAMVLGICGIVVLPLLLSVPALVLGYRAKREIDDSRGTKDGRQMAIAGIVLGWIGTVLGLLALALIVLFLALGIAYDEGGPDETPIELVEPEGRPV